MPTRRLPARQASARQSSEQRQEGAVASGSLESEVGGDAVASSSSSSQTAAKIDASKTATNITPVHAPKTWPGSAPVAIDLGAFTVRIAIGHEPASSIIYRCPNAIARMPQQRRYQESKGANEGDKLEGSGLPANSLVGPQILARCADFGALSIRQPMDRGLVVDWAAQKIILDVALRSALGKANQKAKSNESTASKARLLEGRTVLVTEAYFNLPDLQAAMDLLLIEEYGAKSIWRCAPAYLIPYTPRLLASPRNVPGKRARPECICIVDLGHGGSHVIPVIGDGIVWHAVRRHVISQRLITNLLKETLSFRQWDMMDEPWLVGHIKESCCFVAGRAGHRGQGFDDLDTMSPKDWSFAALTEMCQAKSRLKNRIVQEYVLPDYSGETLVNEFGYIKSGPGRITKDRKEPRRVSDEEFIGGGDVVEGTIANGDSLGKGAKGKDSAFNGKETTENGSGNDDDGEDEDDDDDFDVDAASNSDSGADVEASSTTTKRKKKESVKTKQNKRQAAVSQKDEDAEQILVLERERFQVPEVMFNPGIIGLDDAPLHDVVKASIDACQEEARGPLWGNIVLVGGGASMRNIKTRLYNELRPLAPAGFPLTIWSPERPSMAAIEGAQAMLSSPAQSASMRAVKSHLLPATEYSAVAARLRFDSWCADQGKNGAIAVD